MFLVNLDDMKKFKQKSIPEMLQDGIVPACMAVSRGFLCVVENDKCEIPILVASWWREGWLISLVSHSLQ